MTAEREGIAVLSAAGTPVAVAGHAPVATPCESDVNAAAILLISVSCSTTPAAPAEYPPALIVGSKKTFIPQSASPAIFSAASTLPPTIHIGTAASTRPGWFSASACVMNPPWDSPHATIFLVFGNSFFQMPINSTLVFTAPSAFHPALANPELKTPYPLERRYVATEVFCAAPPGTCSGSFAAATSQSPGMLIG